MEGMAKAKSILQNPGCLRGRNRTQRPRFHQTIHSHRAANPLKHGIQQLFARTCPSLYEISPLTSP